MAGDTLTVLRPVRGVAMAKSYVIASNGQVARIEFPDAKTFRVSLSPVQGIASLCRALAEIEADPQAFVIRGAPKTDTNLNATPRTLRKGGGAFEDVPRRWLALDADKVPLPGGMSVVEEPGEVARHLVELFAGFVPALDGVSCVVQFSASAGISDLAAAEDAAGMPRRWSGLVKGENLVSAHLWFWLATPRDGAELDRWAKTINAAIGHKAIDPAMLRPVQPIYTAAPIFGPGLRDPLAGRRTVLVHGETEAADLEIPAEAPRPQRTAGDGAASWTGGGMGFAARLAQIGDAVEGFNDPINAAIASYVASRWPLTDAAIDGLISALADHIRAADPGRRSLGEIDRYADPSRLRARIMWTAEREQEKRDRQRAEAEATAAIVPTFPDAGMTAEEGAKRAAGAVRQFAERIAAREPRDTLLRVTVGGGKSHAAIAGAGDVLHAAHSVGRDGALYYLVPRHDLGGEIVQRIAKAHPGASVATWRGMDAADPEAPGHAMCRDPDLTAAAVGAGLAKGDVCPACPLREECGYRRQRGQKGVVWLGAHNLAFQEKPGGLPAAAAVVIDESFLSAALKGLDGTPIQLALSALDDPRTGALRGWAEIERLVYLRRRALAILSGLLPVGGTGSARPQPIPLPRAAFEAAGFTAEAAAEWVALEWQTQPKAGLREGMDRAAILDRLNEAAESGFTRLRPMLAKNIRALLEGTDATSVAATLIPDAELGREQGTAPVVRFAWRQDFADWLAEAPKLYLDATTHPDVVRVWSPTLEVAEVEIAAPHQHVTQVAEREFGRSFFAENPHNIDRLADLALVEMAKAGAGDVLVIVQEAVEGPLRDVLLERFEGVMPGGLHLAHHGNLTGIDRFRDVARIIVAGRPAMNRRDGERLAEIIAGRAVGVVTEGDKAFWPMAPAGIRLANGAGHRIEQPRHPDPLVEAVRWSVTEGAVLQAIGRCRGVRRAAEAPAHVTLLARMALPLTVEAVREWGDVVPDRLTRAAAEAALTGNACPFAPDDMRTARPDLWPTAKAADLDKTRRKNPHPLIDDTYKRLRVLSEGQAVARYRKPGGRAWSWALVPAERGQRALEGILGPLAAFELQPRPAAGGSAQYAPPPARAPVPPPSPAAALPDAALDWLDLMNRPAAAPWSPLAEPLAPVLALPETPREWPAGDVAALLAMAEGAPMPEAPAPVVWIDIADTLDLPALPGAMAPTPLAGSGVRLFRIVPPAPAPDAVAQFRGLAAALDDLPPPPRLWGDVMDLVRLDAWQSRLAAWRERQAIRPRPKVSQVATSAPAFSTETKQ